MYMMLLIYSKDLSSAKRKFAKRIIQVHVCVGFYGAGCSICYLVQLFDIQS